MFENVFDREIQNCFSIESNYISEFRSLESILMARLRNFFYVHISNIPAIQNKKIGYELLNRFVL